MSPNIYINRDVKAVIELHQDTVLMTSSVTTVLTQLKQFAENLWHAHQKGNESVCPEISNWSPNLIGKSKEVILNTPFSITDARITIAKEHGFKNWEQVQQEGGQYFDISFERAIDALVYGQFEKLKKLLSKYPYLLNQTSPYGHQATLLHYAGSNGVETRRQIVPSNLPEITQYLIKLGANKNATMNVYGGQFNTLQLASTSAHPHDAGIRDHLLTALQIE